MKKSGSVCGKIILSGEYAVVFGYPGIATPVSLTIDAEWEAKTSGGMEILLDERSERDGARKYIEKILACLGKHQGMLNIRSTIPIGRGMGSSTALVIAITRAILGKDSKSEAMKIEDTMNPGHSGLDFAVIWDQKPVLFRKGFPSDHIQIPKDILNGAFLIDTGKPNETTPELVAWVKSRAEELSEPLKTIGQCTEKLIQGGDFPSIVHDHHRAQMKLGVVPENATRLIHEIEKNDGSAKVLGAGGRTAGGGMVLILGINADALEKIAAKHRMPFFPL
ncbi:hypothetical protein A2706_02360 [Candidatus Peribacteria bacterium RIFCSPHIGHO2_01_FULL_51_35]|nr:MAG: hypothetical protein A2706_02360 [Candidatus Peribacteria bacterium RIFCSPHIGHO2_01_FULL_51_35]